MKIYIKSNDSKGSMEIVEYNNNFTVSEAIKNDEPMLAVISFDGKKAYVSHDEDSMEHHILLLNVGLPCTDIDKYFRIHFDKTSASWTCICPPNYNNISNRERRIEKFIKDGYYYIGMFLKQMGYNSTIEIPHRYSRHFKDVFSANDVIREYNDINNL